MKTKHPTTLKQRQTKLAHACAAFYRFSKAMANWKQNWRRQTQTQRYNSFLEKRAAKKAY